ncbi:MAG: hypothetical protein KAR20_15940, partial [Candidatus Heimdallarchaeota archaeon]|nr:hypothetical protein [Candidatus Heimdallarchaeota archaeon]
NDISGARFLVRRDLAGVKLESERLRIADSTLEMINESSGQSPILMVLEDLHWADESSLYVISYLARNIEKRKIMIVETTRPLESQKLDKFLKGARDAGAINEIDLYELTVKNVELIIAQIFPNNNLTRSFAESIASRCTGNPFFIIETLKQMKEDGSIALSGGCYSLLSEEYSIPSTVEDLVFTKLEKLKAGALTYLQYASCIGMEFSKDIFTGMNFMTSSQDALLALENSGILLISNGTVKFNHGLFQDTIYKSISTRWRSLYHKSAGEHFEIAYEGKLDDVLYDLARHFSYSNEYNKSLKYSIRAGEKAENAFAPEQANEFYKISLNSMKKI